MKSNSITALVISIIACLWSACSSDKKETGMQTVTSKDGTSIAYEKSGNGPVLILVGGALGSHAGHDKLAKALATDFTVYNYDRRGRGDSGDTTPYAVQREIEDIDALLDAAGGSAFVYGVSSGACLALEATAALGSKVKKLAIYEAPYDEAPGAAAQWKAYSDTLRQHIAADRNAEAVEFHLKFVGVPAAALTAMKVTPRWSDMKTLAPTLNYDVAIVGDDRSIPVERLASIQSTTLVMDGGASLEKMPFMRTSADKIGKAIPNAQRRTVEGGRSPGG